MPRATKEPRVTPRMKTPAGISPEEFATFRSHHTNECEARFGCECEVCKKAWAAVKAKK